MHSGYAAFNQVKFDKLCLFKIELFFYFESKYGGSVSYSVQKNYQGASALAIHCILLASHVVNQAD